MVPQQGESGVRRHSSPWAGGFLGLEAADWFTVAQIMPRCDVLVSSCRGGPLLEYSDSTKRCLYTRVREDDGGVSSCPEAMVMCRLTSRRGVSPCFLW